jgi:hypothetical protein
MTVTLWAMRLTNSMSCSITITERSLADALQQLAGQLALAHAHAGDGLVEHQQLRLLHQQHADLEPLLLAVRQQTRFDVELVAEADFVGNRLHPLRTSSVHLKPSAPNTLRPRGKDTSRFLKTLRFS